VSTEADNTVKKRPALLLAEFDKPDGVLHAAEKVRDAGYDKWDVHTPYPIHGMDAAMGLGDSRLGWLVLLGAFTGVTAAFSLMIWANGIEYPIIIGGKPPISIPSMIPIAFELTVLFSAFACFFGMLGFNSLPKHYHPVFFSDRFRAFSTDKLFISIEVNDAQFDLERTRSLLESTDSSFVELVEEEL
jgi:hypothetical protein